MLFVLNELMALLQKTGSLCSTDEYQGFVSLYFSNAMVLYPTCVLYLSDLVRQVIKQVSVV